MKKNISKVKPKTLSKMKYNDYFGPMEEEHIYHVYNQGNNGERIFRDDEDRARFKDKMLSFLSPFVVIIAYVLMDNHFHIVFRVKRWTEMMPFLKKFRGLKKFVKDFKKTSKRRFIGWNIASAVVSEMFRRFIMGYAKYYNHKYKRSGSLFRKGFRHKGVSDNEYLKTLVAYIHRNPMHHGYKVDYRKYKWSSYSSDYEMYKPEGIDIKELRLVYGSVKDYLYYHEHIQIPSEVME